jgi:hypothetical protein
LTLIGSSDRLPTIKSLRHAVAGMIPARAGRCRSKSDFLSTTGYPEDRTMTMENGDTTGPTDLAQCRQRMAVLKMIHMAMLTGTIMFGFVAYFITKDKLTQDLTFRNHLTVAAWVAAAISVALASQLRGVLCKPVSLSQPTDFRSVWQQYTIFVLIRCALLEGGAMFSVVAVLVTKNILPGIPFAICAVALARYRPTQQEFVELFKLE